MNGVGAPFLRRCLQSIKMQEFQDYEVIVSDHSTDLSIYNVCAEFHMMPLIYMHNEKNRGSSSANFNNAIKYCSGDIIKVLMQDDCFLNPQCLAEIAKVYDDPFVNWSVCGSISGESAEKIASYLIPYWTPDILLGNNRIGSPSVLSFRNEKPLLFNEKLLWMMDCDYYYRLFKRYGLPNIVNKYCIFVSHHPDQLTNILSEARKMAEVAYTKEMYKRDNN